MNHNIKEIVAEYADKIFGFCINRLNNIDDAQDLSQEILLEIIRFLPKSDIKDISAWIWKIAHNRYARRFDKIKRISISLNDESIIDTLADDREFFKQIDEDNSEEIKAVFSAVHSLAQLHRDILIDYYVNELSYAEIANKHKLSVNTVKSRLFYGRQKLKERWQTIMNEKRIYEKLNWDFTYNGYMNDERYSYLTRQICMAIAQAAYEKPLTPTEISIVTGIPCMYVEDEVMQLLEAGALIETNGKYATNFVIYPFAFTQSIRNLEYNTIVNADLDEIVKALDKYDAKIRDIGFIGNDRPQNELRWLLVQLLIPKIQRKASELSALKTTYNVPPHKDDGYTLICANEYEEGRYEYSCGNHYGTSRDGERIINYYWSGAKYYSQEINRYLWNRLGRVENNYILHVENIPLSPDVDKSVISDAVLAEGIKYKLIEKTANGYKWTFMFFSDEQMKKLDALIEQIANDISDLPNTWAKAMSEIDKMYRKSTPERLHNYNNHIGSFGSGGSKAIVCELFVRDGTLAKPDSEYFTKSIVVVRK